MMTFPAKAWPPMWLIRAMLLVGRRSGGGCGGCGEGGEEADGGLGLGLERWWWNSVRRRGPNRPHRRSRVPCPQMRMMGWRREGGVGGLLVGREMTGGFCDFGSLSRGGDWRVFSAGRRKFWTNARWPLGVLLIWGMYWKLGNIKAATKSSF